MNELNDDFVLNCKTELCNCLCIINRLEWAYSCVSFNTTIKHLSKNSDTIGSCSRWESLPSFCGYVDRLSQTGILKIHLV